MPRTHTSSDGPWHDLAPRRQGPFPTGGAVRRVGSANCAYLAPCDTHPPTGNRTTPWLALRATDPLILFLECCEIALFSGHMTLDHTPRQARLAVGMWNERKMPERWYELLRERMQIEEQRMCVIRDGGIVDNDYQEDLLAKADNLDREMLLVIRQAIVATLVREAA